MIYILHITVDIMRKPKKKPKTVEEEQELLEWLLAIDMRRCGEETK